MELALRERSHIHIVSPSRHQALSAPLVVGLIESAVQRTYDDPTQSHRLLLTLDELANVAPLPGLAGIVSEGGGQGVARREEAGHCGDTGGKGNRQVKGGVFRQGAAARRRM